MQFRLLACALAFTLVVTAQPDTASSRPQMTWQGEATGTSFLYVKGKRLQVESKDGATIENQRYRFNDILPPQRQTVRLRVAQGRGYVHIVDQPRADNDYTLAIEIDDRQSGTGVYSIALYWEAVTAVDRPNERGRGQVKWSGRVDDEVIVSCAANRCTSQAVAGSPVMREKFKFARPLPPLDVEVRLDNVDGRGEVRLVQQPNERNGYTARVQIRDAEAGTGEYSFSLSWKDTPARSVGEPQQPPSEPGLLWSGRVAGTIRVTVHGGAALSEVVSGQPVTAEQAVFHRPLPARSDLSPVVKKRVGRGEVSIVESPSNRNGYQLVFEIRDSGSGSDLYEVEVSW